MKDRFKQVLEEADKRVAEWPEWKKSEDLKLSEQSADSKTGTGSHPRKATGKAKSATA